MGLQAVISSGRQDILERWAARARETDAGSQLQRLELEDHIPGILDELAAALQTPGSPGRTSNAAEHGKQRLRVGFDVDSVVREYGILQHAILDVADAAGVAVTLPELRALSDQVFAGITRAVAEYALARTRMLEMFVAIMGHDLRDPLSAIMTGAATITAAADLPEELLARITARIIRGAQRMSRQIDELVDVTRTGLGGSITVTRRWTDLEALARSILEEHELAHPDRVIRLECSGPCSGSWDSDRMARVFSNLLQNATRHGAPTEPVTIRLLGHEDHLLVEVHNLGEPIPPDRISVMFEPFQPHPQSKEVGLGLGLHIVREIVRAHEGTIDVESADAGGTTFRVRLPRGTS